MSGMSFGMVTTPSQRQSRGMSRSGLVDPKGSDGKVAAGNSAVDEFLAYMKKSLAERMADAWLAAHGLDRDKLKAMKPEQREAVLKQMAEELKQQLQQATQAARSARKKSEAA